MPDETARAAPRPAAAASGRTGVAAALARRWPTALALGLSALNFSGSHDADGVYDFAETLLLLPLLYLVVAAVAGRRWTWAFLVIGIGLIVALQGQDRVEPAVVLLAVALAAVLWGSAHGRHRQQAFLVHIAGMVAFGALALIGMAVDPDVSRYVVAAGWLAHGIWDFAHLRANAVVSRSFAEWCGVVDVVIAVELVVLPLLL